MSDQEDEIEATQTGRWYGATTPKRSIAEAIVKPEKDDPVDPKLAAFYGKTTPAARHGKASESRSWSYAKTTPSVQKNTRRYVAPRD